MSEIAIMREILVWLSAQPQTIVWRQNVGVGLTSNGQHMRFGVPGQADILGCWRGRALAVEVKAQRGKQTDQQKHFQAAWERAGGIYIVARSVEETRSVLERIA